MRNLGAYYTPETISKPMADWAIANKTDNIMDPSFGGCSFITSSLGALKRIGSRSADRQVFGCDVDPIAFNYLRQIIPNPGEKQFYFGDFFDFQSEAKFDAILGNPPYIKYDNIPKNALIKAKATLYPNGHTLNMVRPNYWTYFILKSLTLLKEGGKMALVLPSTFIDSRYSKLLRDFLSNYFSTIDIIPLVGKAFENTEENTVIALFSGFSAKGLKGKVVIHAPCEVNKVKVIISQLKNSKNNIQGLRFQSESAIYKTISDYSKTLGDYFEVKIGIVTGSKEYFVMSRDRASKIDIDARFLKPVFSRASDLNDTFIQGDRLLDLPYLLVIPEDYKIGGLFSDSRLDNYLESAPQSVLDSYHARHRNPWYSLRRVYPSPIYLKNINSSRCHLYYNTTTALCTNNILRLIPKCDISLENVRLFSHTTLFQHSAFLSGIKYGRKALKIDPSHASKIAMPYVEKISSEDHREILKLIPHITDQGIQNQVDDILLGKYLSISKTKIKEIRLIHQEIINRDFK